MTCSDRSFNREPQPSAEADRLCLMDQGRGHDAVEQAIRRHMKRTFDPRVIAQRGAAGSLFRLDYGRERLLRRNYKNPVLVARTASTRDAGAAAARTRLGNIAAFDAVARGINGLVATGAEPLMVTPHVTVADQPAALELIARGLADACVEAGCALMWDGTAAAPEAGEEAIAVTVFALGVASESRMIDGSLMRAGDVILGLEDPRDSADVATPPRIYAKSIQRVLRYYRRKIAVVGMAAVTGSLESALASLAQDDLQPQAAADDSVGFLLVVRPKYVDSVIRQLRRAKETVVRLGVMAKS